MLRRGRFNAEEKFLLDPKKSNSENALDIIKELSSRSINDSKRLSILNTCIKLLNDANTFERNYLLGVNNEEFLYCLSSNLVHQLTQIRAGCLRAIRYLLKTSIDLQILNNLQIPFLIVRSLDVLLKNEEERIQALKLVRRMLLIAPDLVSPVIVRCLVALGESERTDDRILRAVLATLCEFGVLNPTLLIVCGGIPVITRNLLECPNPRISESLCGVLLHLLDWPQTRNIAGIRLDCLAAPYCDFTYRLGIMDKNKDARDLRFTCSRLALLSVLKSYTGTLEFCNPNKASGLKAIIDILYLNQLEVRKAILDLLYELIGLPQPVWTDEYSVALSVIDPSEYQDSWRFTEGFVATEGRYVLPSLASNVPNIWETHLALLLYCFIENGLLNALVEVIVSSDTFISVRATVLLAKFLQLMHSLLPADICSTNAALPNLVAKATSGNHLARAAISALATYHHMLRKRPASCSLYLDIIIQNGELIKTRLFKRDINAQESLMKPSSPSHGKQGTLERTRHNSIGSSGGDLSSSIYGEYSRDSNSVGGGSEDRRSLGKLGTLKRIKFFQMFDQSKEIERLVRDSLVLFHKDPNLWDWDVVVTILRTNVLNTAKVDENQLKFIRTLTHYFKPTSNRFSHQDLGLGRHIPPNVTAGIELIDWLVQQLDELEYMRILTDFCTDLSNELLAITKGRGAHHCLFSPHHMNQTSCFYYFLFIGRMCRTKKGIDILKNTDIIKHLMHLVQTTNHVCYVKLIVTGLDYSLDSYPRLILEKALTKSPNSEARLFATQFLLVLLRAKIPTFEAWGMPLILKQLADKERGIVLAALEIIEEACHEKTYLLELAHEWPRLDEYNEFGKYIMMHFFSIPRGLNHPNANIKNEIELWVNIYNKKYVLFVESEIHACLTLHTKNEKGIYSRRSCSSGRQTAIPPNIPCHLYGALVQTTQGINNLQKYGNVNQLIEILSAAKCYNEDDCLNLKSALWALGHCATNTDGVEYLNDPVSRVYEKIIYLAKYCEVYSIRATAFNVLCLIACTHAGANILYKLDWIPVRHDRNTYWPISEPEDWFTKHLSPARHLYSDVVPPYNYTGIDENILNITNNNMSYFIDESGENTKESTKGDPMDQTPDIILNSSVQSSARSATLPSSNLHRPNAKHIRSLSESKTTDGINWVLTNRTRFNSGDSNTSGVSSSDSVFNRTAINEKFRRMSLTGAPIKDHNIMTPQDLQGYKKLRAIRRNLRPMVSESAADDLADIFEHDTIPTRTKFSGLHESKRKIKIRSLERQYSLNVSGLDDVQKNIYVAKFLQQIDTKGHCYIGICLPRNILDLFPEQTKTGTYVSRYIQELEILESNNISSSSILMKNLTNEPDSIASGVGGEAKNFGMNSSQNASQLQGGNVADESVVSSMSDISTNSKRNMRRWNLSMEVPGESANSVAESSGTGTSIKHNRNDCLLCTRSNFINRISKSSGILQDPGGMKSSMRKGHQDISFNSPDSNLSDDSNINVQERISSMILRKVEEMGNPVFHKHGKQALLELKQKYPKCFQDICLYSEVSKLLSKSTYRLACRRFIQEIFFDLSFDVFYDDLDLVIQILELRLKDTKLMESLYQQNMSQTSSPPPPVVVPQLSTHKIHAIKSPQLASVYETSVENLVDSLGKLVKEDDLDGRGSSKNEITTIAQVEIRPSRKDENSEKFQNRHSSGELNELNVNSAIRRRRFNTLELDLSCTKNKFPLTHRTKEFSPTSVEGGFKTSTFSSYSSFSRTCNVNNNTATSSKDGENSKLSCSNNSVINLMNNNSNNNNNNGNSRRRTSSGAEIHDDSSETSKMETTKSLSTVTSPTSPPFGRLYCEQRLLSSSKSEAALTQNNKSHKT